MAALSAGVDPDGTLDYVGLDIGQDAEAQDLTDGGGDTFDFNCLASSDSPDTGKVRLDGWTTGDGNELTVNVDPANRHTGKGGTGYRIIASGGFDPLFDIREDFVNVVGVALKNTQAGQDTGGTGFKVREGVAEGLRYFEACLAYECGTRGYFVNDASDGNQFVNCIALSNGQDAIGGDGFSTINNDLFFNCVSINNNSGTTYPGRGFYYTGAGACTLTNCYAGGNDGDDYEDVDGTLTLTTCHAADLTGDTQTALATGSGTYFTNVTAGSEDINVTSVSSGLYQTGTDLDGATPPVTVDYAGTARHASTPTVGAYEFVAAPAAGNPWYQYMQEKLAAGM